MRQEPPFQLERADIASPTWVKLRKHLEAQLESLRRLNDNDLDPIKTAKLRGKVQALKNLLALDSPAPAIVADEEQLQ